MFSKMFGNRNSIASDPADPFADGAPIGDRINGVDVGGGDPADGSQVDEAQTASMNGGGPLNGAKVNGSGANGAEINGADGVRRVHRVNGARIEQPPAPESDEDVPLCWSGPENARRGVASAQFDDLLPPLIVAAMSGRPVRRAPLRSKEERLAAATTVGPNHMGAAIHFWGVGLEGDRQSRDRRPVGFRMPKHVEWVVHAIRGPFSAAMLREEGVTVPDVYGDPFWFAPRILRFNASPMRFELGVVPPPGHRPITALQRAANRRYEVPRELRNMVDVIDLECEQTSDSIASVARKLGRCKRLLVANPRLLTLGEALGVPVALIGRGSGGVMRQRIDDDLLAIPALARDIYGGLNSDRLLMFRQLASETTNWETVIRDMDELWEPAPFDPWPLFQTFPMHIAADFHAKRWVLPRNVGPLGERREESTSSPLAIASRIAAALGGGRRTETKAKDAESLVAARRAAVRTAREANRGPRRVTDEERSGDD